VLITTAVQASAPFTRLSDPSARLRETEKGLSRWLSQPGVTHVVVCDGSGFDFRPMLRDLCAGTPVTAESLSFANDAAMVKERGKGWGEGEIVKYALTNSRILDDFSAFAKCTGKLWVPNFSDCLKGFNGTASFDFNGWLTPKFIDTRFYIAQKDFYSRHLIDAHQKVFDSRGFYLEHAFLHALRDFSPSIYVMFPTPRIRGMSGSMAAPYAQSKMKSSLRDIRSYLVRARLTSAREK
jgi:hypothetical protein